MSGRGVVAAGHALTAEAGGDMLRAGGNAYDAVIAAVVMSCVCEPVLCSPGGTGFAMLRDGSTGAYSLVDFFGQTPLVARQPDGTGVTEVHADFGPAAQAFHIGPATSATPGFFAGLDAVHRAGASMSMPDLFAPAIEAARSGVTITPFQHYLSTVVAPILTASPSAAALFAPGGGVRGVGDRLANPGLADCLEVLARDGFAGSDVGRACVTAQEAAGHLTATDLESYQAIERESLTVAVGGCTVHMNPLPAASGALIAHSLRHLDSPDPVDVARALAATGEARRQARGDLRDLGTVTLRQRGTTHVSVIDSAGNACAVSVSNGEGNGEIIGEGRGFGFMLNNILGEEDVNPVGVNGWPVDTRLSSMMCPTMIETADGSLLALGSGGSNRIRSAICRVVVETCLRGTDLRGAIEQPRVHVEGDHLDFEDLFDAAVTDELRAMFPDHRGWPEPNLFFGGVHAVSRDATGAFVGVGDARRDGASVVVT